METPFFISQEEIFTNMKLVDNIKNSMLGEEQLNKEVSPQKSYFFIT